MVLLAIARNGAWRSRLICSGMPRFNSCSFILPYRVVCHHRLGLLRCDTCWYRFRPEPRKLEGLSLTVLLTFNSRRRQVFFRLLYTESPSSEMERAVNALPLSVLKTLSPGVVADERSGFRTSRCLERFLKRCLGERFGIRRDSLYLALPYGVPPSVRCSCNQSERDSGSIQLIRWRAKYFPEASPHNFSSGLLPSLVKGTTAATPLRSRRPRQTAAQ